MATIDQRYENSGFVNTRRTRMGFSPKFTITRKAEDQPSTDIVIWIASGHPEPNNSDVGEVIVTLARSFPDRRIMMDTSAGLTTVHKPIADTEIKAIEA
jgi:hypothetical protein